MAGTAQSISDIVAVELERVMPLVTGMYEAEDHLCSMMEKVVSEDQSTRNMRIPLAMAPGGKFRQVTFDGGDQGRGSGTFYEVAQVSPLDQSIAIEYTKKTEYATNSKEKSVANTVQRALVDAMVEFKTYKDILLQGAGNGVTGTILSGPSVNAITMATPFFETGSRYNQTVQVYNSTLATNRGSAVITSFPDPVNHTLTASGGWPAGTTSTDKIVIDGLTGASPVSLFGLAYHQSTAQTGTWLTLNRATYPQLWTPGVTASSLITPTHPQALLTKVEQALGSTVFDTGKWIWYMHPSQHTSWVNLQQMVAEVEYQSGTDGGTEIDYLVNRKKQRTIGGITVMTSIHADQTRIDLTDVKDWARGTLLETQILNMAGNTKIPVYGASGGFGSAELFYIGNSEQFVKRNPRRGGVISSLTIPSSL